MPYGPNYRPSYKEAMSGIGGVDYVLVLVIFAIPVVPFFLGLSVGWLIWG